MSIKTVITQVAAIQGEISGIKQVHDSPPASVNAFPCFVNFMGPAEVNYTGSRRETRHTVKMQLYVSKQVTPQGDATLRGFIDTILDKFDQHTTINDTCAYSMITGYEPGVLMYGNTQYLGISFTLLAVEHESRTFA